MKKTALILLLTVGTSCFLFGQAENDNVERLHISKDGTKLVAEEEEANLKPLEEWSAFQLAIFPRFPAYTINSNVKGFKFGLFSSSGEGRVYGAEISIISSATSFIRGFQASLIANVCEFTDGVQAGLINVATNTVDGLQVGLVNYSAENAVQIGLVNVMPDAPLMFFPIVNIYTDSSLKRYRQRKPAVE